MKIATTASNILERIRHNRGFINNFSWLFGAQGITSSMSFLKGIVMARALGVEVFGIFGIIIAFTSTINQFVDFRISETVTRYLSEYMARRDTGRAASITKFCYILDFSTGILAFLIITGTASLASKYFLKTPDLGYLIIFYALTLIISTVNGTSESILHVFSRFRTTSVLSCGHAIIEVCFISAALLAGANLRNVFAAILVAAFFHALLLNACAFRALKAHVGNILLNSKLTLLKKDFKEIFFFSFNTNLTSTLKMFATNIDVLLLGYIRNPQEVGIYKIAVTLVGALYLPIVSLTKILYPTLSKVISEKNYTRFRTLTLYSFAGTFGYGIITVSLLWLIIDKVIVLFYGADYVYAGHLFAVMSFGAVFGLLLSTSRPILLSVYDTVTTNISLLIIGLTWIIIGPVLTRSNGYEGTAIVYSVALAMGTSYSMFKSLYNYRKIKHAMHSV